MKAKWYVLMDGKRFDPPADLRIASTETGEILGFAGLSSLMDNYLEMSELLGSIAEALGPDVLKRWEDGKPVHLVGEIAELRGIAGRPQS